ncbi:unnamed protein product [Ceutorhynchus assimilis]|uniref:Dynein axonemal assembly factor 1 homolog n=1 Tax=Ceutorhynchus assimilis TaxID=467358 RepID=A0A9N9QEM3_9CUCU|nr:unnamed protein product [Ceutorhynchus assimilis]
MLNPCKEREPRVIDNALIAKCIDLQYPKGEVGRLLRLEGIPMEEIQQIRFEYLYILKIDHLWVLKSLVKLSLNNNFIEKIENLESLVHLKELDLSFNKIAKIENLDSLVKLEKITLYENLIEVVENMDQQVKLTVFSIGKNRICNKENLNYFRRFPELTSLNMAGNPCTGDTEDPNNDIRLYVGAFLPTLVYYEYIRISNSEREQAIIIHDEALKLLEKNESKEIEEKAALAKELRDAEIHSKMFVEHLNNGKLFETMYERDVEGKALLDIGEEVTELYEEYKAQILEYSKQVFRIGERHYNSRNQELDLFHKSVWRAKKDNQEESIQYMEKLLGTINEELFPDINNCKMQLEHDAITEDEFEEKIKTIRNTFEDLIHLTWKNLMRLEVTLFEQVEEVNTAFGQGLGEMINTFIEEVQGVFTNIRAAEVTYSETLQDAAIRFMTAANVNPEEEDIPASLTEILIDRDTLNNAMAATHDIHMQVIDSREDVLIHRSRAWLEALITELVDEEIARDRYKLLEINHFLDIQREEFDELATESGTLYTEEYEI